MSGTFPPADRPESGAPGPRGPQYQGPGGPYSGAGQGPGPQPPYGQGGYPPYPGAGGPAGQGPGQPPGQPSAPPPGYPGSSGPGGPQYFGPGYGPQPQAGRPPGPPPKKGFPLIPVIIGAVVLALVAGAVVVGVVLSRRAPSSTLDPTGSSGPGGSSAPPLANKPSDAVRAYLEALAAGNAEAALALGDTAPSDTTYLTNEALAASQKLAPLTDINVPEVDDEYAYRVSASYKLGKQSVNEDYSVTKEGDGWKLRDSFNEIDLGSRSSKNLPTIINGVQAKTTKVRLFPGAYDFTTGSDNISWGEDHVLLVQSPSEYPRGLTDIRATLTDKGEKAFEDAVAASVENCLKSKKISNPGCPNDIDPKKITSTYKFKDGTIDWEARDVDAAVDSMSPRLDFDNPSVANSFIILGLQAEGDCNAPTGRCTLYPTSSLQPQANMLAPTTKVSWTR